MRIHLLVGRLEEVSKELLAGRREPCKEGESNVHHNYREPCGHSPAAETDGQSQVVNHTV